MELTELWVLRRCSQWLGVGRPEVKLGMLSLRCSLDIQVEMRVCNGHVSLGFRGEVWAGDLHFGVINL